MMHNIRVMTFFHWWLEGLTVFMPRKLRSILRLDKATITIELNDNRFVFKYYPPGTTAAMENRQVDIHHQLELDEALAWQRKLATQHHAGIILLLPGVCVLSRRIVFPAAAAANLNEALDFEIARRTPFDATQVYYDYRVLGSDKGHEKIKLELVLVLRQQLDAILTTLKEFNIKPDRVISSSMNPDSSFNLLPAKLKVTAGKQHRFGFYLALASCLLFIASFYTPLLIQEQWISEIEAQLQQERAAAISANKLLQKRQQLLEQVNFLATRKQASLGHLEIIDVLSSELPDDTWLLRLSLADELTQITGESGNVSSLVQKLEGSPYFNKVEFKSPTTRNNRTDKEKFNLSMNIAERG
ncbi:MAG: PilN domain-containing protein [Gammaproteobacteria bacterium]